MIEAIYAIGKVQPKKPFLEEFIEDIGDKYKNVFKIVIDISDVDYKYIKIEYEEFDSSKKMKYFYKKGSSNGVDKTPTSKITTITKTMNRKIKSTFAKFLESKKDLLSNDEKIFIEKMQNVISNNFDNIKDDLISIARNYDLLKNDDELKEPSIITFIFRNGDSDYYVGDLDLFKNAFKNDENASFVNFYEKSKKISKANDKYCYICKKPAKEVWGFANTYNFYTVDKESFVSGGFDQSLSWRNYPVCSDCAKILEAGKKYADTNLVHKFCGFNYYIVPELIIQDDNLLKNILKKQKKDEDFSLKDSKSAIIKGVEEAILRELSKEDNNVNFNFLFFEKSNSAFKILLYIREIAPTRLKFLIDSKDVIDGKRKYDIFEEIKTKKQPINFDFSFSFIREFFPNNKRDGRFDKYFLSILNDIFIGRKISIDFLANRFMDKIRSEFLNDNWIDPWILKAYKILIYLDKINILERSRGNMKNYGNDFEDFFEENKMLDDETKKALFLEGVLAKKLLNIQSRERNATPFRSRLNGLKIDERIAKRLLPEMINKLEEYDKNYYSKLEEAIGEYMLNAIFENYSIDELSYYFVLGMVLSKYFKFENNND